jgi:hypothetical protein
MQDREEDDLLELTKALVGHVPSAVEPQSASGAICPSRPI